jgi:ferredoxin-type protein NapH
MTGSLAWENINPVTMTHRGIIYGIGLAWIFIAIIFVFDLLIAPRGWCGHLCPTGAFYALLGHYGPLKITANNRSACDDCGECYRICPEPQVLKPALKGPSEIITANVCNNCGRCIDVCPPNVFRYSLITTNPTKSKLQQVETMETER